MAINLMTGKPRWIYDLQGRISSSPSVVGNRVCITTYTGAVGCFGRRDGHRIWLRYFRRNTFQWEGFYASPSTDGSRIFTVALSGTVLALSVRDGHTIWTNHVSGLTYGTPSISHGRVFVATLGRAVYAFRTTTGAQLWSRSVPGRVLGPTLVSGNILFFSTLEGRTYGVSVTPAATCGSSRPGSTRPGSAPRAATTSRSTACSSPSAGRTARSSRERLAARLGRARRARRGDHAERRHPRLRPLALPARRRASTRPPRPLVRAADHGWDLGLLRSLAMLAGVLVVALAVWAAFRRVPWKVELAAAVVVCATLLVRRSRSRSGCGRRPRRGSSPTTRPTSSSSPASSSATAHTPYGADYGSSGLERFYSLNGSTSEPESHAALRHFAYFPGAALMAAAWGVLPGAVRRRRAGSWRWRRSRCCRPRCSSPGRGARSSRSACCWPRTRSWCGRRGSAPPTRRRCCCSCSRSRSCSGAGRAGQASRSARRSSRSSSRSWGCRSSRRRSRSPRAATRCGARGSRAPAVVVLGFLPFAVADPGALWADTVSYGAGTYRIVGYGLSAILLNLHVIADRNGAYPFFALALLVWAPVTAALVWAQLRARSLWMGAAGRGELDLPADVPRPRLPDLVPDLPVHVRRARGPGRARRAHPEGAGREQPPEDRVLEQRAVEEAVQHDRRERRGGPRGGPALPARAGAARRGEDRDCRSATRAGSARAGPPRRRR